MEEQSIRPLDPINAFKQVNLEFIEGALELMEKMLRSQYSTTAKKVLANEIGGSTRNLHSVPAQYSTTPMNPELANDFGDMIHKLLRSAIDRDRIFVEENRAVGRELDRLDLVRAFYVMQSNPTYTVNVKNTSDKELIGRLLTTFKC